MWLVEIQFSVPLLRILLLKKARTLLLLENLDLQSLLLNIAIAFVRTLVGS